MALVCQQTPVPAAAILKYEKTLGTSLRGEQLPLNPPPHPRTPPPPPTHSPLPLFSGFVYLLSFVMASRKIHFK